MELPREVMELAAARADWAHRKGWGDAHELMDAAIVAAWRAVQTWRDADNPESWLNACITNALRNAKRQAFACRKRRTARLEGDVATTAPPEESIEAAELRRDIRRAMQTLTPRERSILEARFFHGLSLADVGFWHGRMTPKVASDHIARALAKLKPQIEEHRPCR